MLEVERETCAQVKRDEIAFESLASLLKGFFIIWTNSQYIVSRTEGLKSMVMGGIG